MARKTDDLLADLDSLGLDEDSSKSTTTTTPAAKSTTKPQTSSEEADDPLADLQAQLAVRPQQAQGTSRPSTPRMSSSTTTSGTGGGGGASKSPGKQPEYTPASSGPPSGRSSEDRLRNMPPPPSAATASSARTSAEGARSYHVPVTPAVNEAQQQSREEVGSGGSGGGGWWGSMFSAASAAVKQAETLAKEIRGNEDAQRWAEQVRGNISNLQHFGTDLTSKALPTFTSLIQHIAPPISAHERLQIHTTHDILNYPSLDPLIYSTFARIMAQVEGGDLLVIQRGSENRPSRGQASTSSDSQPQGYRGGVLGGGATGWTDGPWWREEHVKRDLGAVQGLREGTRLARVSAEAYAKEFFEARGGVEAAAKAATETLSESNPVRSSDIFLAVQAVSYMGEKELFADGSNSAEKEAPQQDSQEESEEDEDSEQVAFAIYLHDPLHSLSFSALSQAFPARWASWLDAQTSSDAEGLPQSIQEVIEAGGVDPREWVSEWMEETLTLGVGIVAQRYVARRMGVGEGGMGMGRGPKRRAEEEGVGGEAARAV